VIRGVPPASCEVKASYEGNESSVVRIPGWGVGDDALLVVGIRAGREFVLKVVR